MYVKYKLTFVFMDKLKFIDCLYLVNVMLKIRQIQKCSSPYTNFITDQNKHLFGNNRI